MSNRCKNCNSEFVYQSEINPDYCFNCQPNVIRVLAESNRQLREENAQIKSHLNLIKKYPAKCNDGPEIVDFVEMEKIERERDQLREELEKEKSKVLGLEQENVRRIRHLNRLGTWAQQDPTGPIPYGVQNWVLTELESAMGSAYRKTGWQPSAIEAKEAENRIATPTTALAAAKEALQTCRCLEPEQREAVANALARIAECEKET